MPESRFRSQLVSIMEVLANAAVLEICELVEDGYTALRTELNRREKEIEGLRRKLLSLELRTAREKVQRSGDWTREEPSPARAELRCRVKQSLRSRATVHVQEEPRTSPPPPQVQPKEECDDILIIEPSNFQTQDASSSTDGQIIQPLGQEELKEPDLFGQRIEATLSNTLSLSDSIPHDTHSTDTHTLAPTCSYSLNAEPVPIHATSDSHVPDPPFSLLGTEHAPHVTSQTTMPATAPLSVLGTEAGPGSGGSVFVCPFCGKSLASLKNLKIHVRVHTGEKPFACAQCGKRFSDSSNLKRHQSVHTGERRYRCTHCGKGFAQSGSLKVHLTIHTGQRGVRCPECGKTFISNAHLRNHMSHSHTAR